MTRIQARGSVLLAAVIVFQVASTAPGQHLAEVLTYTSGSKSITVETFRPAGAGTYPAVVLLHGSGGLEQATGATFRQIAATLASRGYVAIIPQFFEKTDHAVGAPIRQGELEAWGEAVADGVEFAGKSPSVDPARFAMLGYSMGSGLAMRQSTRDPRIKAVVSCSGAYPPIQPNKKLPPLLILHGSKDQGTPLDYVKKYEAALTEQEMPHAVHIYGGIGHNFDAPRFEDATRRSVAFFDQYVKEKPAAAATGAKREARP